MSRLVSQQNPRLDFWSSPRAGCSDSTEGLQLVSSPPLIGNAAFEPFPGTVPGCRLSAQVRNPARATSLSGIEEESSENTAQVFTLHVGISTPINL